jgi:carbonic anhydrase
MDKKPEDKKGKEKSMSVIDEVLQNNLKYADQFTLGHLPMPPARKLAVLACMDARLTVEQFLGLKTGDAHLQGPRTAGQTGETKRHGICGSGALPCVF